MITYNSSLNEGQENTKLKFGSLLGVLQNILSPSHLEYTPFIYIIDP